MTGFLLDTNIISELRKPRPNDAVVAFISAQSEDNLFLSEVTFAEIRFGIEQLEGAEKRAEIAAWVDHTLRPLFAGRTLALSEDVVLRWRLMIEGGRRRGHTFGQLDLFIAALAADNGLIVVSRDRTHFVAAGVPVLDPFSQEFTSRHGALHSIEGLSATDLITALAAHDGKAAKQ